MFSTTFFRLESTNATFVNSVINVGRLNPEQNYTFWMVVEALTNGTATNTAYVNCTEEGALQDASATVVILPIVKLVVEDIKL